MCYQADSEVRVLTDLTITHHFLDPKIHRVEFSSGDAAQVTRRGRSNNLFRSSLMECIIMVVRTEPHFCSLHVNGGKLMGVGVYLTPVHKRLKTKQYDTMRFSTPTNVSDRVGARVKHLPTSPSHRWGRGIANVR